jgi:hypothetical protein
VRSPAEPVLAAVPGRNLALLRQALGDRTDDITTIDMAEGGPQSRPHPGSTPVGPCRLALWQHDDHLVCEARDTGHLDDPLAGRRHYDHDTVRGRGLFVVKPSLIWCAPTPNRAAQRSTPTSG